MASLPSSSRLALNCLRYCNPGSRVHRQGIGRSEAFLAGIVLVLAAALRVCNLGTFSPWLDEVFQLQRVDAPLEDLWKGSSLYPDLPPGSALLMRVFTILGSDVTGLRMVSILFGLGSIGLLMMWVSRRFGRWTGLLSGALVAVSPYHIRYSQELRPYPYIVFLLFVVLISLDVLVYSRRWRSSAAVALSVSLVIGMYFHDIFLIVALPSGLLAAYRGRKYSDRVLRLFALAASAAVLLYLPLLPRFMRLAGSGGENTAQTWGLWFLFHRWEFLTVGWREGSPPSMGGAIFAFLVMVGLVWTLMTRPSEGMVLATGVVLGILGIECGFHFFLGRWTAGRYDILGWPFLVVLSALGISAVCRRSRILGVGLGLSVFLASLHGVMLYHLKGREHWDRIAEAIALVRRQGEPVIAESIFGQIPLAWELRRMGHDDIEVMSSDRSKDNLLEAWSPDCSLLLVRGGSPQSREIREVARRFPELLAYPPTGWLYRFPPKRFVRLERDGIIFLDGDGVSREGRWPPPSLSWIPTRVSRIDQGCLGYLIRDGHAPTILQVPLLIDFERPGSDSVLLGNWGGYERSRKGATFRWATGTEVGVVFQTAANSPLEVRTRIWPYGGLGDTQRIRILIGNHEIFRQELHPGKISELKIAVPRSTLTRGENLLVFQFARAVAPAAVREESKDRRTLACAFDRIEVLNAPEMELSPPDPGQDRIRYRGYGTQSRDLTPE